MCLSKCPPHSSVIVSCRIHLCFRSARCSPSLCHAFSLIHILWMSHNAHSNTLHTSTSSFSPPSSTPMGACALPFLPLFCPSLAPTIPAPRLPASLQPSPLPLPRSSIVSVWFSSLSHSCSMQPCLAFTAQPEPKASTASHLGLRGGEGKHFKLQIQPGKQPSADSRAHLHAVRIRMFADIYWFASLRLKYTYPLCLCAHLSSCPHPLICFKQTTDMLAEKLLTLQFSDKPHGSNMSGIWQVHEHRHLIYSFSHWTWNTHFGKRSQLHCSTETSLCKTTSCILIYST